MGRGAQAQAGGDGGSGGQGSGCPWVESERETCQPTSPWIYLLEGIDCHFPHVLWAKSVREILGRGPIPLVPPPELTTLPGFFPDWLAGYCSLHYHDAAGPQLHGPGASHQSH